MPSQLALQHRAVVGRGDRDVLRSPRGRTRGGPAGRLPCRCRGRCGGRRSPPRPASCRAGRTAPSTGASARSASANAAICSAFSRRRSPLIFRNAGSRSPLRRRQLQLRRVREDFRDDAVDEAVVELDAALLERLREHVVDERGRRLVARLVAREGGDRRRSDPDRAAARRTRPSAPDPRRSTPAPAAGKPGYSRSPTRTPDATSGGVARYTTISEPPWLT